MNDKGKILPLVEWDELCCFPDHLGGLSSLQALRDHITAAHQRQRNADWERIQPLMEAISAFLPKLAECEGALAGIYGFAFAHGILYEGPDYNKEREAIKLALAVLLGGQEEKP